MITILGASGFVGSHLEIKLKENGIEYYSPGRNENIENKNLGDVVFCIGMTADFRRKPFETVEAHVCKLKYILEKCSFNSLTYLSSTRVYFGAKVEKNLISEDDNLILNSTNPFDLFAASKITGELLALNSGRNNIKIARLSNVFGSDFYSENFITSIVKDALLNKRVEVRTTPDSSKDYVSINDVCEGLISLASLNDTGIYNLAAGFNTENSEILNEINKLTRAEIIYISGAEKIIFPQIDNSKLFSKIGIKPGEKVVDGISKIVLNFKSKLFA